MPFFFLILLFGLSTVACGTDEDVSTSANELDSDKEAEFFALPEGKVLYTLEVTTLSGIQLPFQLEISADQENRILRKMELRAVGEERVSDVLETLIDVEVGESNEFTFSFIGVTVPGAFIPTGSDIVVDIISQATLVADGDFCGEASGEVVSLGLSIGDSFFGTQPWAEGVEGPSRCEDDALSELIRIDASDCPDFEQGTTTGFTSGNQQRSFELALPQEPLGAPVVFVFHGFGGNGARMLNGGAKDFTQSLDAIVVAPDGLTEGAASSWDTFKPGSINEDITFFDDLLTCLSAQYQVDESRIYATGMSFGGLMTGALMLERPNFFAAVAPMSGGTLSDDLSSNDDEQLCLPSLVLWGGEDDQAFDQDFDLLSTDLLDELDAVDAPRIACNHGKGHVISPDAFQQVSEFFNFYDGTNSCEEAPSSLIKSFEGSCISLE